MSRVAGFTSTGSKRPEALFGAGWEGLPVRMTRSAGCRVWDDQDREYLDFLMALGAVSLGYGHPGVTRAAVDAVERGTIGPVAPVAEEQLAALLHELIPGIEQVRFLKTGAEAVAAAVRIARAATGRDLVLGCGYHGWLDWCSRGNGIPAAVSALYQPLPFNDPEQARRMIRAAGDRLACVVIEPVVDAAPTAEWLQTLRQETSSAGAILIYDEIKTAFRVATGGAAARWAPGAAPDLWVLGKAIANGFPLSAVGGSVELMRRVSETWISSTTSTEFVSLAAAIATLDVVRTQRVPDHLATVGDQLWRGLERLAANYPERIERAAGVPELCYLRFREEVPSQQFAQACARRGLLFKRNAYNFVSLAHDHAAIERALVLLDQALREIS